MTVPWRPLVGVALAATMLGCATEGNLRKDVDALREEIATQRRANDELRSRVEQLEARTAHHVAGPAAAPANDDTLAAIRDLPVVKVEPPATRVTLPASDGPRAPPVDTHISMREPTAGELHAIDAGSSDQPVDLNAIINRRSPAESVFATAMSYYAARDWKSAAFAFRKFVSRYPKDERVPDAVYMEGMSLSAAGNCGDAAPVFNRVLKVHPRSDSVPPTMLALAQCEARLGHPDKARALLQRLVTEHPSSAEATQAQSKLEELAAGDRS